MQYLRSKISSEKWNYFAFNQFKRYFSHSENQYLTQSGKWNYFAFNQLKRYFSHSENQYLTQSVFLNFKEAVQFRAQVLIFR